MVATSSEGQNMAYKMLTLNTPQRVFFYKYMSSENENDFLVILIKNVFAYDNDLYEMNKISMNSIFFFIEVHVK